MSLFVCSKCGCIDNTATSYYWALMRPCKNRIYDL
nr:MAG TPA: Rubredoxin loop, ELECTRON TRANSPORT [Bacteriophage sp.]